MKSAVVIGMKLKHSIQGKYVPVKIVQRIKFS
jgi:hypothetical protein